MEKKRQYLDNKEKTRKKYLDNKEKYAMFDLFVIVQQTM